MRKPAVVFFAIFIFMVGSFNNVYAEDPIPTPSSDDVNAIAKNMYCPVCENIPLDVCPTTACIQWRAQINEKLTEGWSEQQIYDYFVSLYGDRVLAAPPKNGLNWLIYILPPAAILGGVILFVKNGRKWRQEADDNSEESTKRVDSQKSEYQALIEKDLEDYD